MKWIGLLDANNFFVSCERLFRPDLRTRPTVVLSGNDGCVVARSKEVKDMSIPMGIPHFKVKKEFADAHVAIFSSNFPLYRDVSARVMETLKQEVGVIEQYSVDEAFFEIAGSRDRVFDVLSHIKNAVETRVGVPVSVGAAKTKTIAKYASEVGKRGIGTACIYGTIWQKEAKTLPMSAVWGVGSKTSQKMREHGVVHVADFLKLDKARVDKLFGIGGLRLQDELSEKVAYRLGERGGEQKSIMSTRSFKNTTTEQRVVEDAIAYHVAHAAEELRGMDKKASWISVMAHTNRHGDWLLRGGSKDTHLHTPSNDTRVLLREALTLFRSFYEKNVPYKKAGIVLGGFIDADVLQYDLFAVEQDVSSNEIMRTMDALNKQFGKETVTIGRQLQQEKWKASREYVSPAYTTNWDQIREINA